VLLVECSEIAEIKKIWPRPTPRPRPRHFSQDRDTGSQDQDQDQDIRPQDEDRDLRYQGSSKECELMFTSSYCRKASLHCNSWLHSIVAAAAIWRPGEACGRTTALRLY